MTLITLSKLEHDIDEFLAFKRALGYRYQRGQAMLKSFLRYAQKINHEKHLTLDSNIDFALTLEAWLSRTDGCKPFTVALYLGVIRQFCLYNRRRDPTFFVPEHAQAPKTESVFSPYIFSFKEIQTILNAAGQHQGKSVGAGLLRTLLLILYCTGLRFGEAVRLRLSDVDLKKCVFHIRESKGRTRLVPFGKDLAHEISLYLKERSHLCKSKSTDHDALFIRLNGRPLTVKVASEVVRRLLRQLGYKPPKGRRGPRPYDLRHAFAVHRLTEWYEQGVDIHARLPWLSAYMGHVNLIGTQVYLHATPQLLEIASDRFEKRLMRPRNSNDGKKKR